MFDRDSLAPITETANAAAQRSLSAARDRRIWNAERSYSTHYKTA
jgi:hypothetical protein